MDYVLPEESKIIQTLKLVFVRFSNRRNSIIDA